MAYRVLCIWGAWVAFSLMTANATQAMEPLPPHALDGITGQATAQPSNETRETTHAIPTETTEYDDILQVVLPKPRLLPSTLDTHGYSTVFMDFLGVEADAALGIPEEDFHGSVTVGNIVYTDEESLTSVILAGSFTGHFEIPTRFSDGLKAHQILASASRIPGEIVAEYNNDTSDFILSYQGTTYTPENLTESDQSFTTMPNRQVQTVGRAGNKDLHILAPQGHGDKTTWNLIATISKDKPFVQIDVNRLVTHHALKYTVKIANNRDGLNAGDPGSQPTDRSGTLGTLYMRGNGKTAIEPGTVVISTFDTDI